MNNNNAEEWVAQLCHSWPVPGDPNFSSKQFLLRPVEVYEIIMTIMIATPTTTTTSSSFSSCSSSSYYCYCCCCYYYYCYCCCCYYYYRGFCCCSITNCSFYHEDNRPVIMFCQIHFPGTLKYSGNKCTRRK